jgi:hypothetical protein
MSGSLRRTAALALLVTTAAGCASAPPLNPVPGAAAYERELLRASASITPATTLERIGVIAHDSMGGRNTPSPGLEKTAEYFASKYREWGVQPGGENGTYFQRYPLVRRHADQAASWLEANENGTITRYPMGTWAYATVARDAHVSGNIVVMGGTLTPEAINGADIAGKIVMLVHDAGKAADWARWGNLVAAKGPSAILRLTNQAPEAFSRAASASSNPGNWTLEMPDQRIPAIWIHDSLFAKDPNRANRPDFGQLRAAPSPVIQVIPEQVQLTVHTAARVAERTTAPNVIGIIPGSDPVLRNEYVVFSAHMDHVGTRPTNPREASDTIWNGADDDASGSTGILMVAEAFSRLAVKPRRSIMIIHVSAEERGLLGSQWFAEHPTVPAAQMVANVNFDMIGRNHPDSVSVIGRQHSDLGTTLDAVNARHPDLRLTLADDLWPGERFYFRSDHYNFARKGVPILFFFSGPHEDYHGHNDEVERIDEEKIARIAKVGFFFAAEIANTPTRPAWNPESYREIVEGPGGR